MANNDHHKIKNAPDVCIIDEDKVCDNCCECFICDLDPNKICDNCAKCLELADYNAIEITEILYDNNIFKYGKNEKSNKKNIAQSTGVKPPGQEEDQ